MAQLLLGQNEAKRIDSLSLFDDTVNNRIADIANDILNQLIAQNQDSPGRISLQFDETTDIKSISQSNHCAIHKYDLACKTLPLEFKSVLIL